MAGSVEGNQLLAQLLYNRGIIKPRDAVLFFSTGRDLSHDPFLLNGMDRAVERVIHSLVAGEPIAIYGDYDADGITGAVLLTQVLSHLGGHCHLHIPRRLEEGYGLNCAALGDLARKGVKLVIAVDCGTNDVEEARFARKQGIDLIIADHHTVGSPLPLATALLNPKRLDSAYPFRDLASVGVAYKLAQALLRSVDGGSPLRDDGSPAGGETQLLRTREEFREDGLLDLVALGTVADLAPLVGENRYLVKRGLEVMNSTKRIGIRCLVKDADLHLGAINASTIGFVLGPRLNAAGRLDDAVHGFNLLNTNNADEAGRLSEFLKQKNAERQGLTADSVAAARKEILPIADQAPILVSSSKHYPQGVLGLVAGKLVEEFYKPAVVMEEGDEECRGSARSIPEFNIVEALAACSDLLVRFGGHAQAAGFTLKRSDLPRFRDRLMDHAASVLQGVELQPTLNIDAQVALSDLRGPTIGLLNRLEPYGQGNPVPVFLTRHAKVERWQAVGSQKSHLMLWLSDGKVRWQGIGFGLGSLASELSQFVDVVYSLEETTWNGERSVRLRVIDLRPSGELRASGE